MEKINKTFNWKCLLFWHKWRDNYKRFRWSERKPGAVLSKTIVRFTSTVNFKDPVSVCACACALVRYLTQQRSSKWTWKETGRNRRIKTNIIDAVCSFIFKKAQKVAKTCRVICASYGHDAQDSDWKCFRLRMLLTLICQLTLKNDTTLVIQPG